MMGAASPRGLNRAIVLSVVGHVAVVAGAIGASVWHPSSHSTPQTVLVTKLVRLGRERPPDWLPRKLAAPPPAEAPVPLAVKAPEPAPSPKEPLPSARERVRDLGQVTKALERLKRQDAEEPEGRADGVRGGEVSDLAHAIEGNRYATEIFKCLQSNYAIEGVSESAVRDKSATVLLHVAGDGSVIDSEIERGSGVAAFDRAVLRALKLCSRFSPPPEVLRDQLRNDGIEVEFQP